MVTDTLTGSPPLPQNMLPLQNLGPEGPPKHRLRNAADAQTIYTNLWQASQDRNLKNAAIQGQIDGNPPYSPAAMKKAGRATDANFNTLEAKALRSTALVPYYDLFAGGNRFVEVRLDLGDTDDFRASYASGIVSEEYDRLLRRWRNFENVMFAMMCDLVTFGKGFLQWARPNSWRVQKVAHYRVMVPDATPIDIDELELFIVINNWPVTYLQDKIRDEASARAAKWNVEATRKAIMAAVPVDPSVPNDAMATQAAMRESDVYVSARNATVQCATFFVKEFDGKWSELVIRRDQIPTSPVASGEVDAPEFLFEGWSQHDCVQECLNSFFFEVSDSNWNGAAGLGRDIFVPCQLKDRTTCSQLDSLFLRNSIILQPRQETDRSKAQLMQLGKMTLLPPGMEAQQGTILGDIASTIEVSRELSLMIERNTGIYRPTLEKGGGNPDTLGEFQAKFAQATVLSTSAINRFYSQLDRFYEVQWKRVIDVGTKGTFKEDAYADDWQNEARRFVARCEARGVGREMLEHLDFIRAFRTIGNGSAALRQQTVSTFLNPAVYPLFPPDGQVNILEDFTRILGSQTAVNRYLPPASRQGLPTSHQWDAMQENASMKIGAPVTWTPGQNNLIHAQFHLQAGAQAAASLQQGANPLDVLAYLDAVGAHTADHLKREEANPMSKPAVKALWKQWDRLAQIADKLRQQAQATAEQQQENQQKAQDVITDADIKRMDVTMKNQISREKAQGTLALKAERQQAEMALKAQQMAGQSAVSDASTAASIHQQTAKTAADITHAQAKTAADIENARLKAEADAEAKRKKAAASDSSDDSA